MERIVWIPIKKGSDDLDFEMILDGKHTDPLDYTLLPDWYWARFKITRIGGPYTGEQLSEKDYEENLAQHGIIL